MFLCAAHTGGISEAINKPAEMIIDNLAIQSNVIDASKEVGVKKLLFLGSSCIYPVDGKQPYNEEQLGTGKTDENWSYAVAKLAGIELCRAYHKQHECNFITAIPCNMYGINDNFGENGHVIPSLICKFYQARNDLVEIWGDGTTKREFLYSDDFAEAAIMLMEDYNYEDLVDGVINIGTGEETSISDIVNAISVLNAGKRYIFNREKPNGVPCKLMDNSRITEFGWKPVTFLESGIANTVSWYNENCMGNDVWGKSSIDNIAYKEAQENMNQKYRNLCGC